MKKVIAVCVLLIIFVILAGCTEKSDNDKIIVTASFYPVYIAALNVFEGIEAVDLKCLTQPSTGCLHDYQLSPGELINMLESDVLIVNGGGMESFLDKALENNDISVVYASEGIEWLEGHHELNAHAWLDVSNYIKYVENIKNAAIEVLSENDAEKAKANAEGYIEELKALETEIKQGIDGLSDKKIITFHEAFDYFAKAYGLEIAAVIELEPGVNPSPDELKNIIDTVNSLPKKVLFSEPQYDVSLIESIANQTGAEIYVLDPVVTGSQDKDEYIRIMRQNLKNLTEALK